MGIALLTLSSLFQGFSVLKTPSSIRTIERQAHPVRALRMVRPSTARTPVNARPVSSITASRPAALRVVRVCEPHPMPGDSGRMVISGRMADVCAELDRLAAHETLRSAT